MCITCSLSLSLCELPFPQNRKREGVQFDQTMMMEKWCWHIYISADTIHSFSHFVSFFSFCSTQMGENLYNQKGNCRRVTFTHTSIFKTSQKNPLSCCCCRLLRQSIEYPKGNSSRMKKWKMLHLSFTSLRFVLLLVAYKK